uniref:Zinc knuckle CX2CX4HX4C domain-containing protein n=1 Tax=Cannabis sativa TaxID=3483 RepID=A0A803PBN6_CANSA
MEADEGSIEAHQIYFIIEATLAKFRSHELAKFIASEIGYLIEVDRDTVREGTGPYLRLRILLDVNLPIRRGMNVRFIRMGREFIKWLDFKYERPLDFYFYCGCLDNTKRYCHAFLQKCDETHSEPLCPFTILLRGKEKISDKSAPFQYPHSPTMTLLNIPTVDLSIPARDSSGPAIRFPSFLINHVTFGFTFTHSQQSAAIMIPTPINPNIGGMPPSFSSYGDLALDTHTMELEADALTGQPDLVVRGKGLVSASGVKRPSFQAHQAVVGGSLRSTLKRAHAGDSGDGSSATNSDSEQAGDAEHIRPEK